MLLSHVLLCLPLAFVIPVDNDVVGEPEIECGGDAIEITFMTRNPRAIFTSIAVVVSFHPLFLTKVDRVYNIQCFYMEADKTVNQQIKVAELTIVLVSVLVPMPVCRYEILSGGPDGDPLFFAIVGQQVYHKWTCDSEFEDTFCMVVRSCFVGDGQGRKVDVTDRDGCAIDRHYCQPRLP